MDRRTFLRGATVVGSGVITGGAVAGCSGTNPDSSGAGGGTSPSSTTGHGPPDWSELAASLVGPLLPPGDNGYAAAGHLYNSVYTQDAMAIAQCQPASDVQRCLAFAREHNVEVVARSGGHSYGGYSSCPGLVIDVTNMDQVSVDGAVAGPVESSPRWEPAPSSSMPTASWRRRVSSCPAARVPRWGSPASRSAVGSECSRGLRAHVRSAPDRRDRDGGRGLAAVRARAGRGSVLGLPRRGRRELRRRHVVRVSQPSHS